MVQPRGEAHGALGRCKKSFAEARGPNAGDPGPDAKDCGVWSWKSEKDSSLREKLTLRRLLLQVLTPGLNI